MIPFLSRSRRERELDDEIRTHLQMAVEERITRGETREEAERAVRREFGNAGRVKEVTRAMWGGVWLDDVIHDLGFALRSLRRDAGFAVVAILTIALGVGVTTAMFTVVNGILLRRLPFYESERLVTVSIGTPSQAAAGNGIEKTDFEELSRYGGPFTSVAGYLVYPPVTLTGAGEPTRLTGAFVTAGFASLLRVVPVQGPGFRMSDHEDGAPPTVILSNALWRARFGGDPDIIGESAVIEGRPHAIVGVMPPGFDFPQRADLWLPWSTSRYNTPGTSIMLPTVARLRDGVSARSAAEELDAWAAGLDAPALTAAVVPLKDHIVGESRYPLVLFTAAVALVLLIACTNVANLLLMRAGSRHNEIGLRKALGAGNSRIVRQLLTESVALALIGGALGLFVAGAGVEILLSVAPSGTIPRDQEIGVDASALVFALGVATFTGVLFGLAPALQAARRDPRHVVNMADRSHTGGGAFARGTLVIAEVGLAVVLLAGTGLLIRSFLAIRAIDLGFEPQSTLAFEIDLPPQRYGGIEPIETFYREVLTGLGAIPGVESSGSANFEPFGPLSTNSTVRRLADAEPESLGSGVSVGRSIVSPEYFRAMGIALLAGRPFDERDNSSTPRVIIVNRSLASSLGLGSEALGERVSGVREPAPNEWMTIVGVVEDVVRQDIVAPKEPMYYTPLAQTRNPGSLTHLQFVVRTTSPRSVASAMRAVVRSADPDLALGPITSMDELVVDSIGTRLFETRILAAFAVLAVVLAAVGIYGVVAYSVSQRSREIAIRVALGAQRGRIVGMTLRGVAGLALIALALGSLGGWVASRFIEESLYGVDRFDPTTWLGVTLALGGIVVLAAIGPTLREMRVDPVDVLAGERMM